MVGTISIPPPPLDPSWYNPSESDLVLLKKLTGITDDEELRSHAFAVQFEAYNIYPYQCIRTFDFLNFKIGKYPWYEDIIKFGKEKPRAIYFELGCGFGSDVRKLVFDGYPVENIVVSDLHRDFWDLSHRFFKSTPETFPVPFLHGDIFDPSFLSPKVTPLLTSPAPSIQMSSTLSSLHTLTPMQYRTMIIHTASFFHLFDREKQHHLAHLLGSLSSPIPGSMITGSHLGDIGEGTVRINPRGQEIFLHSPSSWKELWMGKTGVFKESNVSVESILKEKGRIFEMDDVYWHTWRVMKV